MKCDTYLQPTRFIDCDSAKVIEFARDTTAAGTSVRERAIALVHGVRDGIPYNPYGNLFDERRFVASHVLGEESTFCIPKAILVVAAARSLGIPARLGFADVRNHLAPERLLKILRTDVFYFHGYAELMLEGKWVKATPAFDTALCRRYGVPPLTFDGVHDSVLQPCDREGQQFMEYIHDYGQFADMPFDLMVESIRRGYPHVFAYGGFAAYAAAAGKASNDHPA